MRPNYSVTTYDDMVLITSPTLTRPLWPLWSCRLIWPAGDEAGWRSRRWLKCGQTSRMVDLKRPALRLCSDAIAATGVEREDTRNVLGASA